MQWDLRELYSSPEDKQLQRDIHEAHSLARKVNKEYASRIHCLEPKEFFFLLKTLESIEERCQKILSYAYLTFATQTGEPAALQLWHSCQETVDMIREDLRFFVIEWSHCQSEHVKRMLSEDIVRGYRNYLHFHNKMSAHYLPLSEEVILSRTEMSREKSWKNLYDTLIGKHIPDPEGLSLAALLHQLFHPERLQRKQASDAIFSFLTTEIHVHSHILNSLVQNKKGIDHLRGHSHWLEAQNMADNINDGLVEDLVTAVTSRYDIVQDYYHFKGELLGLKDFSDSDRYAPLPSPFFLNFSWSKAQDLILESWESVAPNLKEIASLFFKYPWIHASSTSGKMPGVFAHPTIPAHHPYIFLHFKGTFQDTLTLAHEIGHGMHQYLSRDQGIFQAQPATPLAEIASIFSEILLFRCLEDKVQSDHELLILSCLQLEQAILTIFRQISLHCFEDLIHSHVRNKGPLDSSEINALWMSAQRDLYGPSLILQETYSSWWALVPHFFHLPGYVHTYALSWLLVLTLVHRSDHMGSAFMPLYYQLLQAGGAAEPNRLLKPFSIDLRNSEFIEEGISTLDTLLSRTLYLAKKLGYTSDTKRSQTEAP
jgi:oligoendopeptidase F